MPYLRLDISQSLTHLPWGEKFLPLVHSIAADLLSVTTTRMKSTITVAEESLIGINNDPAVGGHVYIQLFCFAGRDAAVRSRLSAAIADEIDKLLHPHPTPISTAVYVIEIPKEGATVRVFNSGQA